MPDGSGGFAADPAVAHPVIAHTERIVTAFNKDCGIIPAIWVQASGNNLVFLLVDSLRNRKTKPL